MKKTVFEIYNKNWRQRLTDFRNSYNLSKNKNYSYVTKLVRYFRHTNYQQGQ